MPETTSYRFGPFLLQLATRRLLRNSVEVPLPPKAFDIIVLLVSSCWSGSATAC
jgi:DNA-binding winged helix-turn-helix (wHTH) protein